MADDAAPISSVLQLTALDPDARVDPYPRMRALRESCPVFYDPAGKATVLTRYADVKGVVSDRSLWRSPARAEEGSAARMLIALGESIPNPGGRERVGSILLMDDPDHRRIRAPLQKALYARVASKGPLIEAVVGEVLDGLKGRERFDLVAEAAIPIPITVIARVLGVDDERLDDFRAWSEAVILFLTPFQTPEQRERMIHGNEAVSDYFDRLMAERRRAPRDDLISDLVALQADGAELSDAEVRANLIALLVGGNLTTSDLIGTAVRLLLTHPDQLARLKADPGLAPAAVEEVLRFDPPVDFTGRIASDDMEVGGVAIPPHRAISACLRAANRDPEVFPDPDRFDIGRKPAGHMAFGGGAHLCIGAPLARLEARAAITGLFARFPDLRLAEQTLAWRSLPFFRGLERLIVETA